MHTLRTASLFAVFAIPLCLAYPARAQEPDSLLIRKLLRLEQTIDSLYQRIEAMDEELGRLRGELAQSDEIASLLAEYDEESSDTSLEGQRSRRKRVDALLKAISERPGRVRFNGGATGVVQGKPYGAGRFATGSGSFDIFAHTSFGAHTLLFIDLEAIGGDGPADFVDTFSSLNDDAGSTQSPAGFDQVTVLEAWAEFTALNRSLTITAGKIDLTNYFDNNAAANDETLQFLSSAFVNSAALPAPGNGPGVRLQTTVLNRFFLQVGIASADNAGSNLFDDLFKIGSVAFRVFPESEWEANLRFYGYLDPSAGGASGFGLSMDGSIAGAFTVFGRYTRNNTSLAEAFGLSSSWSTGLRLRGFTPGIRLTLGAAYGETRPAMSSLRTEQIVEVYLRHQINQWVYISPHLQRVFHASGSAQRVTLLGLRTHFDF